MRDSYILRIDCEKEKKTVSNILGIYTNPTYPNDYWEYEIVEEASDPPVNFVDKEVMVISAIQPLKEFQARINSATDEAVNEYFKNKLNINTKNKFIEIDYYGSVFEEFYDNLLYVLASPEVAPFLRAIRLSGPDEGSNGTRHWNLEPLDSGKTTFSNLITLDVELTKPGTYNRSIVGKDYDEDGVVAHLLKKMPKLKFLSIPSAPSKDFFLQDESSLKSLVDQAGYDTQDFISNLAGSTCFTQLAHLEFTDYSETYMEDYKENLTPQEDYFNLFNLSTLPALKTIIIINSNLKTEDVEQLRTMNLGRQLNSLIIKNE